MRKKPVIDNQELDDDVKSKSQLKRESSELQALGRELVELPDAKLARIPLPETLADAIDLARKMRPREGLRRQMQFIGKVMRSVDEEPIRAALATVKQEDHASIAKLHRIERWRDRLIEEGDAGLEALLAEHSELDRQHLRQLIRQAQAEAKADRPPKSKRAIFRYLRDSVMNDGASEAFD